MASELQGLIERLEKLDGPDRDIDCMIAVKVAGFFAVHDQYRGTQYGYVDDDGRRNMPGQAGDMLVPHYTASLDAAIALCERVLPGFWWMITSDTLAFVAPENETAESSEGATPAIALCLAILRALKGCGDG